MQKTQARPYEVRHYYRALGGETQPRRLVQLPPAFAADIGDGIAQISLGDGTGIVQIKWARPIGTVEIPRGAVCAMDRVRSKKNGNSNGRYTLIDPSIYMRHEQYHAYEDDGTLWIVPVSVHDAWVKALPGGVA